MRDTISALHATTVFPAIAGAFPAVTFFHLQDALAYASVHTQGVSGVVTCPALSYAKHYPDTLTRFERAPANDRRQHRGDDYAGDAWRDRLTGDTRYTAVGANPNGG